MDPNTPPTYVEGVGYVVEIEKKVTNNQNPEDSTTSWQYHVFDTEARATDFYEDQKTNPKAIYALDPKFIHTSNQRIPPDQLEKELSPKTQKDVPSSVEKSMDRMMGTPQPAATLPPQ